MRKTNLYKIYTDAYNHNNSIIGAGISHAAMLAKSCNNRSYIKNTTQRKKIARRYQIHVIISNAHFNKFKYRDDIKREFYEEKRIETIALSKYALKRFNKINYNNKTLEETK